MSRNWKERTRRLEVVGGKVGSREKFEEMEMAQVRCEGGREGDGKI